MNKKKFVIPHVYVIIMFLLLLATIATWIIPAGTYDFMEVNGRNVVDPASFHYIEQTPVSLWDMVLSVEQAMISRAELIFAAFLITGAVSIINHTHALDATIGRVAALCRERLYIAVPLFMVPFLLLGAMGMAEQNLAFVPLGITVGYALGGDVLVGVALVLLGMSAGFSLAPFGTSTTATAQTIAGLPLYSGWGYRTVCILVLWLITSAYIIHYIKKIRRDPTASPVYGDMEVVQPGEKVQLENVTVRRILVLGIFLGAFGALVFNVVRGQCTFAVMVGIFLVAGLLSGVVYGYTPNQMAEYFVEGCTNMAFGALFIGVASSIGLVMSNGNIVYTCVHALCTLLGGLPTPVAAVAMNCINILVNFFIVSGSGQAATVMPILSPTASVLGITQQSTILAYQLGDGFTNMLYPHSGTLAAGLAFGRVSWVKWSRWVWKFILLETVVGWGLILIAVMMNWG